MNLSEQLRSVRNRFDYACRNVLRFRRPLAPDTPVGTGDAALQDEFAQFFSEFDWCSVLGTPGRLLQIADVGCRTFVYAPVIDKHLESLNYPCQLHGIELDAWRRYTNLRCRADYGDYYANMVRKGCYYPVDFLQWHKDLDLLLLLNPFVTPGPLLSWGLPLGTFQPQQIFRHARSCLGQRDGVLLLSSPNEQEFESAMRLARRAGFSPGVTCHWRATPLCHHGEDRIAVLMSCE